MARKSRQSFLKRQREARRSEKAALKRQKRMERRKGIGPEVEGEGVEGEGVEGEGEAPQTWENLRWLTKGHWRRWSPLCDSM